MSSTLNLEPLNLELRAALFALVGAPYGDPRFKPADCWGFVRYCYSLAGVVLPENIWACRHICREVSAERRKLLDIVYLRDSLLEQRHVGVALDNLYVLQSSVSTNGVAALRMGRPGIMENVTGIYRLRSAVPGLS